LFVTDHKLDNFVIKTQQPFKIDINESDTEKNDLEVIENESTELLQPKEKIEYINLDNKHVDGEEKLNITSDKFEAEVDGDSNLNLTVGTNPHVDTTTYVTQRREVLVPFSLDKISSMIAKSSKDNTPCMQVFPTNKFTVPISSQDAEQELRREIHKEMFLKVM
jgi:hypothetical protein